MDTANKEEDTRDVTAAIDPTPDQEKVVEVKIWKQYVPQDKVIIINNLT